MPSIVHIYSYPVVSPSCIFLKKDYVLTVSYLIFVYSVKNSFLRKASTYLPTVHDVPFHSCRDNPHDTNSSLLVYFIKIFFQKSYF